MAGKGPPAVATEPGLVVASHGRLLDIEDAAHVRHACRLHGRALRAVCGDRVRFGYASAGDAHGTVYEVLPRASLLERLNSRGGTEPVVANLTQLAVVVAPAPAPDWAVVDRYLAGAEWADLAALLVLNKSDRPDAREAALEQELRGFGALGYPILHISARGTPGPEALAQACSGATSALVGQSGTGKSSLLNALVPEAQAVTREISEATESGRHTTTTAALHRLARGGALVDAPGVRDYSPPLPAPRAVAGGYRDIVRYSSQCRFQDCLHRVEPDCAVRAAAGRGELSSRRYESYQRLLALAEQFAQPARR
jgi:ribosome biogenesis GTPase / thiamine phosphate phosphatase